MAEDPDHRKVWLDCWKRLPTTRRDVYFLPEYLLANQAEGRGDARCFVAASGRALMMYPFLFGTVPQLSTMGLDQPVFDAQTPYGYGGPVVNEEGEDPAFLEAAWREFTAWCMSARVVAEFCRFHPLLENERWAPASMDVHTNRSTVWLDLESYPRAFASESFFRNHRQMVNRAMRAGCASDTIIVDDSMDWFAEQYARTQDALGAGSETRFGATYFQALAGGLGARAVLRVVRRDERIMTAVLMLESEVHAHAHLMAYGDEPAALGATNVLFHAAALDAAGRGLKTLHLGGGRTSCETDSLLKFKAKLSPRRARFCVGTRCHQPATFERMKQAWRQRFGSTPNGFFLFYRSQSDGHRRGKTFTSA